MELLERGEIGKGRRKIFQFDVGNAEIVVDGDNQSATFIVFIRISFVVEFECVATDVGIWRLKGAFTDGHHFSESVLFLLPFVQTLPR